MDKVENHVQEMLDLDQKPAQVPFSSHTKSVPSTAAIKTYIVREMNELFEAKLSTVIDTALTARLSRLEASRKSDQATLSTLQATHNLDRQALSELDAFHRYEHSLNSALVERLFHAESLRGDPKTRFEETTFDLQGTDSAVSMLISYVEVLLMRVRALEEQVCGLQEVVTEAEVRSQLDREKPV